MRKFVFIAVAALSAAATLSAYAADKKTAPAAAPADKTLKYESSVGEQPRGGAPANNNPHTEDAKYQSSVGEQPRAGAPVSSTAKATEPVKVQSDAGKPQGHGSPPATTAKKK
jgi:hypothetical protein